MLINELPDDCLLTIFDYIQDLEDLINCFKVCEKWCNLIFGRTKRVKYLIDRSYYSPDYDFYKHGNRPIDVTCLSRLFPNLEVADLTRLLSRKVPNKDIVKLIRDSESLKGIIHSEYLDSKLLPEMLTGNIEMLSTGSISPNISEIYENVKQLHLWSSYLEELGSVAHCFPNLERLRIFNSEDIPEYYYDVPVLANLKLLEIGLYLFGCEVSWCSFVFMDLCPALQSAFIQIECCRNTINNSIKNANLQDLVIQFSGSIEWNALARLMLKYPNLRHLALRNNLRGTSLKDEHIKQLVFSLPKLTLLDIRESRGVTQEAVDYVQDYCKQHGRSIKIYFKKDDKQIESDWPQSLNRPDAICRGFDFMEHCFFKSFDDLPHFLDPIDD